MSSSTKRILPRALLTLTLLGVGRANAEDPHSSNDARAILEKVVRAVASNRAQLQDVRAEILVVTENHQVDTPKKTVFHTQNGTMTTFVSPRDTARETIAISGDQLRYDRTGGLTFEELNPDETWVIKPGKWQLYRPGPPGWLNSWSRPEQIGGRLPIDPRDYGCPNMGLGLQKWLETLPLRSAQLVPQNDGTTLIQLQLTDHASALDVECSSRDGFLPSLMVTSHDQTIVASTEISYQPVLQGKAWFPKTMFLRSFTNGAPRGPRSNDCPFMTKWFVTKLDVQSGEKLRPIPQFRVPAGTRD